MKISKVGVVGCGVMGAGIVQISAQAGYKVWAYDISDAIVKRGLASIDKALGKAVEKGKLAATDKDAALGRIQGTTDLKDFAGCDLVIEAATENMELKKKLFTELDKICPAGAILASNTSCLSVIDMAVVTKRPDKVLGMHFFNPAPVMRLLELVKTLSTSEETLETAKEFGKSVGKTIIVSPDTPGFIVNRQLIPLQLIAVRMLEAGVATKEDIDTGLTHGGNLPMGALSLADLVGLDVLLDVSDAFFQQTKDPMFIAPTLLRKMVRAGWLGRKSGKGFYEYK